MIKFLDLYGQYESIRDQIDPAIANVIRTTAFIGGDDLRAFESEFASYQQVKYCVGVANGTDAIEIILEAFGLPPGSEIIVPANSFVGTSEPVTRSGHRVVFADCDPHTYTLDLKDVRRRLTPKTAAIIAVHLYGQPCNMNELLDIAKSRNLKVIEDAAQAHGAEYLGRRVGGIGHAGAFSFYPGKNLGAYGDGGAITTDDKALADKCRMIANHGRIEKYNHLFEGRNSRLDGLQAAILRAKLKHLESWVKRRGELASAYTESLNGVGDLVLPEALEGGRHAFHLYVVRTARRDALASYLTARGIQTGVHYPIALPKLPAYKSLHQGEEEMFANRADATLLSLPIGEHLSTKDIGTVASAIREFFSGLD